MRAPIVLALFVCLPRLAEAEPAKSEKYTLEDLKALGESQGWNELLEHAEDVRPSERKQPWKDLLEKAAVGSVGSLLEQKKNMEAYGTAEQVVTRFPTLKQSKTFMGKRREAGLTALGDCFVDPYAGGRCIEELERFTKLDPTDAELAFGAGKVVVDRGRMYASAPPFFAKAFASPAQRKTGCKDKSVHDAVLRAFGQPPDYDTAKAAAQIAFEQCHAEMKDTLMTAFFASGGYESKNLCRGLVDKKAKLTEFQAAYCQDSLQP